MIMKLKTAILTLVLIFSGGAALAYEEPRYDVVKQYEEFELRRYAPYIVAEMQVSGAFKEVGNKAFRVLADFIFGNNQRQEKMAMTAPVNQQPVAVAGEEIGMTAPVTSRSVSPESSGAGTYVFSFLMPSKYTLETLPKPVDPRVSIRQVPAQLLAARRYSGGWSNGKYREHESTLLQALSRAGIKPVGAPVFARYNSPFTLWFLRRNEVLIEVEPTSG